MHPSPIRPSLAKKAWRAAYEMSPTTGPASLLSIVLATQGKADEIERLVDDLRARGESENWALRFLLWAYKVRGDGQRLKEVASQLEREPGVLKVYAANSMSIWLLASGQFAEAERATQALWRASQQTRDLDHLQSAGIRQSWLQMRRGKPVALFTDQMEAAARSLVYLPRLATFCVETRLSEPLAGMIARHERAEKGSKSRFVREELEFARGCLALIRGENLRARELLEPLARDSLLDRRHQVLGRVYEALGLWREAADQYEQVVNHPHHKWWLHEVAAIPVLDQFRLAEIYERLGDAGRARHWYERFLADWKDADPKIPELIEARKRLALIVQDRTEAQSGGK